MIKQRSKQMACELTKYNINSNINNRKQKCHYSTDSNNINNKIIIIHSMYN
jgi:hypothetical protein